LPSQILSVAALAKSYRGSGAGLKGDRSGTFWPFWKLMKALSAEKRAPANDRS